LLRKYGNERVIIHGYSGDLKVLNEMIEEGYYFSIVPEVKTSKYIRKIVENIPHPGGPLSYLGEKGIPVLIRIVIEEVAKIKGKTPKQMGGTIRDNFIRLAGPCTLVNH